MRILYQFISRCVRQFTIHARPARKRLVFKAMISMSKLAQNSQAIHVL